MQKSKLQLKIKKLRKKYSKFIYQNYSYRISKGNLEILFDFRIEPEIRFRPKIIIKNISTESLKRIGDGVLNNLIFHLGLMEIPSYWKATCSPKIIIKAGLLDEEQIKWWKDLIINGMGQFFYENQIDWRGPNFLQIQSARRTVLRGKLTRFKGELKNRYLVPFAGGRDSIVTLESLKKKRREIALFMANPTERILKTAEVAGVKKQIIVKRLIDKKLLELNKKGYLNGHTPFTALLSFLSVLGAVLFDYKNIVFSNEKSANEGNVKYFGKIINHQWAKSSQFEKMFKNYCQKYLAKNINYFSYLRKYGELEISKMFIKYPKYFSVFSSCNVSMKIKAKPVRWCGNCPKCLFVYATLYPFLDKKDLIKIFGKPRTRTSLVRGGDIFENKKLLPIMRQLIGKRGFKPFECVGTRKESRTAFKLSLEKALQKPQGKPIPYLLSKYKKIAK